MLALKTIKIVHLCVVLRNGKLPYDNMDNLLSLSREGGITSSRKGIVDNLSMTYDGNMLASVSDSAPAPSVTGSADFRGGMSGNAGAHPVEGGVSVAGGSLEIGGETGGMELARPGASQPYRFLGNELYTSNSLGLYDFSARMYDPALGRFLSVDPMAETCLNMTPFAYCGNNPIIRVDPEGEIWHIVGGAVVGAVLEGGSALIQGKTGKEIGAAAVRGAIEGGVVAATGGAGLMVGIISNAGASVVGSAVEQVIANDGDIDVKVVGRDALVSGGLSLVTGKTSEALKKAVEKTVSNPSFKQTVKKSVTDEFKTLGRKESKSTIDRVVENKVRQITKEETKNVEYLINFSNYSALATSGYIFNNE